MASQSPPAKRARTVAAADDDDDAAYAAAWSKRFAHLWHHDVPSPAIGDDGRGTEEFSWRRVRALYELCIYYDYTPKGYTLNEFEIQLTHDTDLCVAHFGLGLLNGYGELYADDWYDDRRPSVILPSGHREWWYAPDHGDSDVHRCPEEGPAIITAEGEEQYWLHGVRIDGKTQMPLPGYEELAKTRLDHKGCHHNKCECPCLWCTSPPATTTEELEKTNHDDEGESKHPTDSDIEESDRRFQEDVLEFDAHVDAIDDA